MEIKQKYRFMIALISLLFLLSLIQNTYAKYVSNASANTNLTIAGWNVIVNTQDITNNSNFSSKISPVFPGTTHTTNGVIAPLSEGYFDISIDVTNVDVSFTETITLSLDSTNTISDLEIVGYSYNNGSPVYFGSEPKVITRDVLLNNLTRTYTYRIYVKWLDGTGESMDNEDDTQATKDGVANVKVDVNFIQKAN